MPESVRRLQVDEGGDGLERRVQLDRRQQDGEGRLGRDDRFPRSELVEVVEHLLGLLAEHRHEVRVELAGRATASQRLRTLDAVGSVRDLRELRQLNMRERIGMSAPDNSPANPLPSHRS